MRVVHIAYSIAREYGGLSRSSQGLVAALNGAGVEAWLLSCRAGEAPWLPGVSRFRAPGKRGCRELFRFLRDALTGLKPDFVHFDGIWRPSLHLAAGLARRRGIPYVVALRGMLDPWALEQKKWKKKIGWWVYQKRDLQKAAAFHATAPMEAGHIRGRGFRQPVIVCANGVAAPDRLPERSRGEGLPRTALFLSRLHPGKGLMTLADAWSAVRPAGWRMRVVGFDDYGEKARVFRKLCELGIEGEWVFEEPMDDVEKWRAYVDADLFIHPSVSENFGISIAEALYAGLPVIATKGAPWRELEERRCGWWIDLGAGPLEAALRGAVALGDAERREMGRRGRALVEERYAWPAIAEAMKAAYEGLLP